MNNEQWRARDIHLVQYIRIKNRKSKSSYSQMVYKCSNHKFIIIKTQFPNEIRFPILNHFIFLLLDFRLAKEVAGNGRSPLLQDPLYGSRPQPYSKYYTAWISLFFFFLLSFTNTPTISHTKTLIFVEPSLRIKYVHS